MFFVGCFGLVLGMAMYAVILKKNHDAFHPIGLMILIWYFGSFLASMKLSNFQNEWSIHTSVLIISTGFILFFWTVFNPITVKENIKIELEKDYLKNVGFTFKVLYRLLFCMTFFSSMYSVLTFLRYGIAQTGIDAKAMISEASGGVPKLILYGNILFPYTVLCAYFELIYDKKRSQLGTCFNIFVIIYGIFYVWFVVKSRDYLSIFLFGIFYMTAKKNNWKFGKIVQVVAILVVLFSVLMLFRVSEKSSLYNGVFSNSAMNATYNYISSSYENLNSTVKGGSHNTPLANTCILLYKLLGKYNPAELSFSRVYTVQGLYNASPFIACYFFDLGDLGVILGTSFVSILLNYLYRRSKENIYSVLVLSMFQKGVFTVCLGDNVINHGSSSALTGYFVIYLICILAQNIRFIKYKKEHLS